MKQQEKLSRAVQIKLDERIGLFINEPFNSVLNNHELHTPYKDHRSINISGNIRAIYEPKNDGSVLFVRVGTHSELYK